MQLRVLRSSMMALAFASASATACASLVDLEEVRFVEGVVRDGGSGGGDSSAVDGPGEGGPDPGEGGLTSSPCRSGPPPTRCLDFDNPQAASDLKAYVMSRGASLSLDMAADAGVQTGAAPALSKSTPSSLLLTVPAGTVGGATVSMSGGYGQLSFQTRRLASPAQRVDLATLTITGNPFGTGDCVVRIFTPDQSTRIVAEGTAPSVTDGGPDAALTVMPPPVSPVQIAVDATEGSWSSVALNVTREVVGNAWVVRIQGIMDCVFQRQGTPAASAIVGATSTTPLSSPVARAYDDLVLQ